MKFTNNKQNSVKKFLIYIFIAVLIGVVSFLFFSPVFERNAPKIKIDDIVYWNLKSPIKLSLSDDNEIKDYEIIYKDDKNEIKLDSNVIRQIKGEIDLEVLSPKFDVKYIPLNPSLVINVTDTSKWNFFMGNKISKKVQLQIDKNNPIANVISNSYAIARGGSAAVVVEIKDENLKDFYISFNDEERFELIPFYKDGFYMAIIAWPIYMDEFKGVNLVAVDLANNKSVKKVPLYLKKFKIKVDDLKINDDFINKVSKEVLVKSSIDVPFESREIFIKSNNYLREKNVNRIKYEARENMFKGMVSGFKLKPFKRLPNSMTFAGYGEKRNYYYNGEKIDEAWHLGIDWASVKKAKIFTSNSGKVIFNEYLGIYGNTVIIDHGYGVASLYAHTSSSNVNLNDLVNTNDYIANTGSSGAVFGDHLHFGILVQGIEVNPNEWQSKQWIKENVTDIVNNSMKVINSK